MWDSREGEEPSVLVLRQYNECIRHDKAAKWSLNGYSDESTSNGLFISASNLSLFDSRSLSQE
jgi:hypothetical protein